MPMPSSTGRNVLDAKRQLDEMRRQARVIANFAEYLAEDVRSHPERAHEATEALAAWCKTDLELLAQTRSDVLRHPRAGQPAAMKNNRYASWLNLDDSAP
jgi:hypothetical protein